MKEADMKKIFLLLSLFSLSAIFALDCSVCQKKIRGKYLKDKNGDSFCSEKCFASTAPKCNKCNKPCVRGAYTFMKKFYCSKECMNAVSKCANCNRPTPHQIRIFTNPAGNKKFFCPDCANKPKCYYCAFPYKTSLLPDRRHICPDCKKTEVSSPAVIQQKLKSIRRKLHRMYGFEPNHHIELIVLDLPQLEKECSGIYQMENGNRMALMRFEYQINEKTDIRGRKTKTLGRTKCRMFVLKNTPADLLEDALAHELTHDYLRHNTGQYTDLSVEEGFAETIAAEYNKSVNRAYINVRKQNTPDPVYGDGYRKMSEMLKKQGFRKTLNFVKSKAKPYL